MYWFVKKQHSIPRVVILTMVTVAVFGSVITAHFGSVYAAPNQEINYQGKLTDGSGMAVANGQYNMWFWLTTDPSAATTTAVWSEQLTGTDRVQVTSGLFSVMLGSTSALTSVDFNQTLYLGVEIGGSGASANWDGEMSPRKILGTVPAAFEALSLGGATSTQYLRNDQADSITATEAGTLLTITQNGAGDILNLFDGGTEVFSVIDGGLVGIGTTTPQEKLSVSVNSASKGARILLANEDNTFDNGQEIGGIDFYNGDFSAGPGVTAYIRSVTSLDDERGGELVFGTSVVPGSLAESMRINSSGAVGIGSTSPSRLLTVAGDTWIGGDFTATGTINFLSKEITPSLNFIADGDGNPEFAIARVNASSDTNYEWNFKLANNGGLSLYDVTGDSVYQSFSPGSNITLTWNATNLTVGGGGIRPTTNNGGGLGTSGIAWSDLFLASGGIIDFDTGDVTATHASNKLTFDGASSGYVFSGGNVGIGTTTPDSLLSVVGSGGAPRGILIQNTTATAGAQSRLRLENNDIDYLNIGLESSIGGRQVVFDRSANRDYLFKINNSDVMTLYRDGNVGIGTTSPSRLLTVAGDTWIGGDLTATGTITLSALAGGVLTTDANGVLSTTTIGAASIDADSLDFTEFADALTLDATTTIAMPNAYDLNFDSNTLVIDSSADRVGIGTANPNGALSVVGNVGVGISNHTPQAYMHISNNYSANPADFNANADLLYVTRQNNSAGILVNTSVSAYLMFGDLDNKDQGGLFYSNATDLLSIYSGGSSRMSIDSTGRIGMGTSSPTARTHILNATSELSFRVDDILSDTSPFVIDADGYVGIGTSTPSTFLHVAGGARFDGNILGSSNFNLNSVSSADHGILGQSAAGVLQFALTRQQSPDAGTFSITSRAGLGFEVGATEPGTDFKMFIDTTGSVGIGSTSPSRLLTVTGDTWIGGDLTATGTITLSALAGGVLTTDANGVLSTTTIGAASIDADSLDFTEFADALTLDATTTIAMPNAYDLNFDSNTLVIDSSADRVGIGTMSPARALHVYDSAQVVTKLESTNTSSYLDITGSGGTGRFGWYDGVAGIAGSATTIPGLAVTSGGNVGIGTTSPGARLDVYGNTVGAVDISHTGIEGVYGIDITATGNSGGYLRGINDLGNDVVSIDQTAAGAGLITLALQNGTTDINFLPGGDSYFNTGNVGIGTTSPSGNLHVHDADSGAVASVTSNLGIFEDSGSNGLSVLVPDASTSWLRFGSPSDNSGSALGWDYDDDIFNIFTAGEIAFGSGDKGEKVRINSDGYVGIGTSSPDRALHIEGSDAGSTIKIDDNGSGSAAVEMHIDGNADAWSFFTDRTSKSFNVREVYTGSALQNIDHLTVLQGGNVGIGSTSPSAKLSITNTSAAPSFIVEDSASSDNSPFIINASGEVGIGTASPASKFHIYTEAGTNYTDAVAIIENADATAGEGHGLRVKAGTNTSDNVLLLEDRQGTDLVIVNADGFVSVIGPAGHNLSSAMLTVQNQDLTNGESNGLLVTAGNGSADNSLLVESRSGTDYFVVKGDGNVGIGSTSPSRLLTVSGETWIGGDLTVTGTITFPTIVTGGDTINEFAGTGLTVSGNALTVDLGTDIGAGEIADGDHGFFSYSSSVASLDTDGLTSTNLSDALTDETGTGNVVFSDSPTFTGTFNADSALFAGAILADNLLNYYATRTVPTTVDDYVEVGYFTRNSAGFNIDMSVTVSGSGFSLAKRYIIPAQYNSGTSGAWYTALPISDTGVYGSNNFALDVMWSGSTLNFRLRRESGATAATAEIHLQQLGGPGTTFTAQTGSGSMTAPTLFWETTVLTQVSGNVGIGDASPTALLTVGNGDLFQVDSSGDILTPSVGVDALESEDFGDFTCNGNSCILDGTYLTGNETITLTGDVTGSGATSITTAIAADSIINADLSIDVEAADGDFLQYDSTGDNFTWREASEVRSDLDLEAGTDFYSISAADSQFEEALVNETGLYAALSDVTQFWEAGDNITSGEWQSTDIGVAYGGTGLSTFGGANTILYTSAADTLTSNANFVFDGTKMGIGTTLPETLLHIVDTGTETALGRLPTNFRLQTNTGTVDSGNEISFRGRDTVTDLDTAIYAAISAPVTANGVTGTRGYLSFSTKNLVTNTSLTERMRITPAGEVGISSSSPSRLLTVAGDGWFGGDLTATGTATLNLGSGSTIADGLIVEADLSINSPTNGYLMVASSSATGGFEWVATSTSWLGLGSGGASAFTDLTDVELLSLTPNRIIYASSTGNLSDTSNFTYDGTNLNVGGRIVQSAIGNSVFIGLNAGAEDDLSTNANTLIGTNAGRYITTGDNNVALGSSALIGSSTSKLTGTNNIGIGTASGQNLTTGTHNTFVGFNTGFYTETGSNNVALGRSALLGTTTALLTGDNNVGVGYAAGFTIEGAAADNTFLGYAAGKFISTGSQNIGVGRFALRGGTGGAATGLLSGTDNIGIGNQSGFLLTTGNNNTLIGEFAGDNITTGSDNIIIGNNIDAISATGDDYLSIGNLIFASGGFGAGSSVGTGNVGIGTSSPSARLAVAGNTWLDGGTITFGSTTSSGLLLQYLTEATSTIKDNSAYAFTIATSTTGNPIFRIDTSGAYANSLFTGSFDVNNGAISYDASTNETSIERLSLGNMKFDDNAGVVSWIDMDVTASSAVDTIMRYSAQIDNTALLSLYAESDGSGGIQNSGVGIGSTSPSRLLTVAGDTYISGTTTLDGVLDSNGDVSIADTDIAFDGASTNFAVTGDWSVNTNDLFVNKTTGYVGVGTTSPETTLHITDTGTETALGQLPTNLRLQTNTGTVGSGNEISFRGAESATDPDTAIYAAISAPVAVNGAAGTFGDLLFSTKQGAAHTSLLERMRITNNGFVGIGTTTPDKLFVVEERQAGVAEFNATLAIGETILTLKSSDSSIGSSGHFLEALNGGTQAFAIRGDGVVSTGTWQGTDVGVAYGGTGLSTFGGSNTILYTSAADTLTSNANFVFDGTSMGIGEASPDTLLHLLGADATTTPGRFATALRLQSNAAAVGAGSEITFVGGSSATDPNTAIYGAITAPLLNTGVGGARGSLVFSTKNLAADTSLSERMRITNAGAVGIGTSTPITGALLTVAGNIYPDADDTYTLGSTNYRWSDVYVGPNSLHIGTDGNEAIIGYNTGSNYISIDPDGDATAEVTIDDEGRIVQTDIGESVFIGAFAGDEDDHTDNYNAFIGSNAGRYVTSGNYNVGIGVRALFGDLTSKLTGTYNVGLGTDSGRSLTMGSHNAFIGYGTGYYNSTGSNNFAIGRSALFGSSTSLLTGDSNIAIGAYAGQYIAGTAANNTFLGYTAGRFIEDGADNIGIGQLALRGDATNNLTGDNNIGVGVWAGANLNTGSNNVLLGYKAGDNLTSGSSNIIIGDNIDAISATGDDYLSVGNLIFASGGFGTGSTIGSGFVGIATSSPSTLLSIGNSSITDGDQVTVIDANGTCTLNPDSGGSWTCSSDENLKHDIAGLTVGLQAVAALRPTTFSMNVDDSDGVGFIAQEVQEILPDLVTTLPDGHLGVSMGGMMPYVVQAFKDQLSVIDILDATTSTATLRSLYQGTSTPAITIDAAGNIAIATSTDPTYRLKVGGDVAATGFINISTENVKTDIAHLSTRDQRDLMDDLRSIDLATYRYTTESEENPLRLGLIAEEAPDSVLSVDGRGVDLYKLSALTLAGVQDVDERLRTLETTIADLTASSGLTAGGESLWGRVRDLASRFVNGVLSVTGVRTEELCVGDVCVSEDEFMQMVESAGVERVGTPPTGGSDETNAPNDTQTTPDTTVDTDGGGDVPTDTPDTTDPVGAPTGDADTTETDPVDPVPEEEAGDVVTDEQMVTDETLAEPPVENESVNPVPDSEPEPTSIPEEPVSVPESAESPLATESFSE